MANAKMKNDLEIFDSRLTSPSPSPLDEGEVILLSSTPLSSTSTTSTTSTTPLSSTPLSSTPLSSASSTSFIKNKNKTIKNRTSSMTTSIQSRMEMPMGERPAASVVRRSTATTSKGRPIRVPATTPINTMRHTTTTTATTRDGVHNAIDATDDEEEEEVKRMKQMPPEPVVGNIVERTNHKSIRTSQRIPMKRLSRFAASATTTDKTIANMGFPSVKYPLGTFVRKNICNNNSNNNNDNNNNNNSNNNDDNNNLQVNNQLLSIGKTLSCKSTEQRDLRQGIKNNESLDPLRQARVNDADAILSTMSKVEIQQSIEELKEVLSPEMIKFIRERNQSKSKTGTIDNNNKTSQIKSHSKIAVLEETVTTMMKTLPITTVTNDEEQQERQEKERLCNVLSSIRTYEDLDQAYVTEMERQGQGQIMELGCDTTTGGSIRNALPATTVLNDTKMEFDIACDLLRSTSHRQVLWAARIVCKKLLADVDSGCRYPIKPQCSSVYESSTSSPMHSNDYWPYPILLPVSLRCLLDEPVARTSHGVQHSYVLQSMYALLLLRAPIDHVVDVRCDTDGKLYCADTDTTMIHQLYYMDDAIPTPSLQEIYTGSSSLKPVATSIRNSDNETVPGMYRTSSTTVSAANDGEEFIRDPMWTMVSKMRIIPLLAEFIHWCKTSTISTNDDQQQSYHNIPPESIVSCCGILSMISRRSPGATSAILQHPTLLHDLLSCSCSTRPDSSSRYNAMLAIPFYIFLCTASRQSRIAAESMQRIDVDSLVLKTLAGSPLDNADSRLQQWALILWRTQLRYGICIHIFPTMLTLAAPHLTFRNSGQEQVHAVEYSLSPEFYSSFTVVFHCVRSLQLATNNSNVQQQTSNGVMLPDDDIPILLRKACAWLSSSKRQAINHLQHIQPKALVNNVEGMKQVTSILRFLDVLLKVQVEEPIMDSGEFKTEELTPSEEECCIDCILSIIRCDEIIQKLSFILLNSRTVDGSGRFDTIQTSLTKEASLCAFFESLIGFIVVLLKRDKKNHVTSPKLNEVSMILEELLISSLEQSLSFNHLPTKSDPIQEPQPETFRTLDRRRRDWYNMAHFSIYTFATDSNDRIKLKSYSREIGFAVLGRLDVGRERTAAILLSDDNLFPSNDDCDIRKDDGTFLSGILVRELCRTPVMQKQVDHSFRLQYGPGLNAGGLGPFRLENLMSQCDIGPQQGRSSHDLTLPMGQYWPWKLLSGSFTTDDTYATTENSYVETISVLESAFQMIKALESKNTAFSKQLDPGGKLYYLSNLCLLPETILSDEKIYKVAESFFDSYFAETTANSARVFTEECLSCSPSKHTTQQELIPASDDKSTMEPSSRDDAANAKKILEPENFSEGVYSSADIRVLLTFVGDLCEVFLEYGYQYRLVVKCIHLFLINGFPTKIRCEVLRRLREVLYLLSLDDENDGHSISDDENCTFLQKCIRGGSRPCVDNPVRDSPDLLDTVTSLVLARESLVRPASKSIRYFSMAIVARSIAINIQMGGSGLSVSKRRVASLDLSVAAKVMDIVLKYLSFGGTVDDLITATFGVCCNNDSSTTSIASTSTLIHCPYQWFSSGSIDDIGWQNAITHIREVTGL